MSGSIKLQAWFLGVVSVLLLLPGSAADGVAKEDAFLDQPLRPEVKVETALIPSADGKGRNVKWPFVKISSFRGVVTLLSELSGKKVLLPEDLREWPGEQTETAWEFGETNATLGTQFLFEHACQSIGMTWHEDVSKNVILLSPCWQREDPRSAKELVDFLLQAKPNQVISPPTSATSKGLVWRRNPWRLAFDGLLSKPGNFSSAGTLRVYHAIHGNFISGGIPVENLFAGKMTDREGHPEILILNGQGQITSKGNPGDLAYYLFDENGRFIKGGVYAVADGTAGAVLKAQADGGQEVVLQIEWAHLASEPEHLHLGLANDGLVFLGLTDSNDEKRNADESRRHLSRNFPDTGDLMRLKYSVTDVPK